MSALATWLATLRNGMTQVAAADLSPVIGLVMLIVVILGLGSAIGVMMHELRHHFLGYLAASGIGAAAGAAELIGRYRDKPTAALSTPPGFIYIIINGFVSLAAYWLLMRHQLPTALSQPLAAQTPLTLVLFAGFGSMAFFRTSLSAFAFRTRISLSGRPFCSRFFSVQPTEPATGKGLVRERAASSC